MSTNPLTVRDKLNAKWVALIGAVIALLGFLLSAVDHVVRVGLYVGDDTGWFLNTPFTSYVDLNGSRTFTSILNGNWLSWLVKAVSFHLLPAVGTALTVLAAVLFLFYVLKGHRMARGTVVLSLSLLALSVGTTWVILCDPLKRLLGIAQASFMNGGFDPFRLLMDVLRDFLANDDLWLTASIGMLIGGGLLIGAVALLLSPRVGKGIACVGISASALLTAVNFFEGFDILFRLIRPATDMNNPSIVWIPSNMCIRSTDILGSISAICVLLLCAVLLILLVANRLTPVFAKKTTAQ